MYVKKLQGWTVFLPWAVMVILPAHSNSLGLRDADFPTITNAALEDGVFTWEASSPEGFTGIINYYHILVYGEEQGAEDVAPIQVPSPPYDLSSLHLAAGKYYVQVRAVSSSGPGPYSDPLVYTVYKVMPWNLLVVVTIVSTVVVGLVLGTVLFSVCMWRMRWKGSSSASTRGDAMEIHHQKAPQTEAEKIDIETNVAYGCSATSTLESMHGNMRPLPMIPIQPHQQQSDGVYATLDPLDYEQESTGSAAYVAESDIHMPHPDHSLSTLVDSPYSAAVSLTPQLSLNELEMETRPSEYLELWESTGNRSEEECFV